MISKIEQSQYGYGCEDNVRKKINEIIEVVNEHEPYIVRFIDMFPVTYDPILSKVQRYSKFEYKGRKLTDMSNFDLMDAVYELCAPFCKYKMKQ